MKKSTQSPFLDKYSQVTRLYAAIISLISGLLLTLGLAKNELRPILGEILFVRVPGCMSLNAAALFLLIQTNRFVGKEIFEKLHMITCHFLDMRQKNMASIIMPDGFAIAYDYNITNENEASVFAYLAGMMPKQSIGIFMNSHCEADHMDRNGIRRKKARYDLQNCQERIFAEFNDV